MKYSFLALLAVVLLSGCSCFSECRCEPQIQENKRLVTPKELRMVQPQEPVIKIKTPE